MRRAIVLVVLPAAMAALAVRGLADDAAPPASVPLADAVEVVEGRCIQAPELVARIEGWLRRSTIDARLRVSVRAAPSSNDVYFEIRRNGLLAGEKEMHAPDMPCAELQSAVALAIASAIDAILLQAEREEDSGDAGASLEDAPSGVLPPDATPEAARAAPADAEPAAQPPHLIAGLESGVAATHLPVATLLVLGTLDIRTLRWLDFRLGFGGTPEVLSTLGPAELVTQDIFGHLHACLAWPGFPVRPRACGGPVFGAFPARVQEGGRTTHLTPSFTGLSLRGDARWPADGEISLVVSASAEIPFARTRFEWGPERGPPEVVTTFSVVGFSFTGGLQVSVF